MVAVDAPCYIPSCARTETRISTSSPVKTSQKSVAINIFEYLIKIVPLSSILASSMLKSPLRRPNPSNDGRRFS